MDTKELSDIARTFSDAIIQQGLTKAELVMLNSLMNAMITEKLNTTPAEVLESAAEEVPLPVPKGSSVKYDDDPNSPTYDPTPNIPIDKVPPRATATGEVIANEGEACTCKSCGRIVYTTVKEIKDNCKASDFFDSFKPFGKAPAMPDRVDIANTEGRISIDCPMCDDKKKSLYLIGASKSDNKGDIVSV